MAAEKKQEDHPRIDPLPVAAAHTVPLSFREVLLGMQPSVPLTVLAVLMVVTQFDARLSLFLAHTIAAVGCFLVMNVVSSSYARGGNGYLRYIAYAIPWVGLFELSIAFRAAHGDMPGIAEDLHRAVFLMHAGLIAVAPLWIGRKVRLAAAVVPWGVVSALLFVALLAAPRAGSHWAADLGIAVLILIGIAGLALQRARLERRMHALLLASAASTLAALAAFALDREGALGGNVSHGARLLALWLLYVAAARSSIAVSSREQLPYRELFQSTIVGVSLTRADGSYVAVNPAYARLFGYESAEELMAQAPGSGRLFAQPGRDLEVRIRRRDGEARWITANVVAVKNRDGGVIGYQASVYDITEARAAREQARLESRRLQQLVELLPVPVFLLDETGRVALRNEAARKLWATPMPEGVERFERYRGWRVKDGMPIAPHEWPIRRALAHGETHAGEEIEILNYAGERRVLRNSTALMRDDAGRVMGALVVNEDITELKRHEAELARAAAIVQSTGDAAFAEDPNNLIVSWNEGARRMYGYEAHEIVGRPVHALIPPELQEAELAVFRTVLKGERVSHYETTRLRKDGSRVRVSLSVAPIRDAAGRIAGIAKIARDITARERAEEERARSARMYAALSSLNELVARAGSPEELLQGACEIAVASGNYQFALVRMVDPARQLATIAAFAGAADMRPWFERPIDLREDSPDAQLLASVAYRSNRPVVVGEDDLARRFPAQGARAAAGYPLRRDGACIGALLLRSGDPQLFQGEMGQLLERMAGSLSLGLERLQAADEQRRFRLAMDHSGDMMVLVDRETMRFVDVNDTLCRQVGYRREELLGMPVERLVASPRGELERAYDALIAEPGTTGAYRGAYRCKDGSLVPIESTRRMIRAGGRWLMVGISRDLRERLAAEEALRRAEGAVAESEARLRSIVEATAEPLLLLDPDGTTVFANPAAAALFGRGAAELAGRPLGLPLAADGPADVDILLPDGTVRPAELLAAPTLIEGREVLVVSLHDLSERKRYEAHIEHLANHDGLTGLPNRTLLRDRVEQAIAHARRTQGLVALLFVDLDHFKLVNDSLGHAVGDALLLEVGQRLKATVRDGDTVARLGGDEFVIVAPDLAQPGDAAVVARKIAAALGPIVSLDGRPLQVDASIGISLFPGDGEDLDTLLQCADAAMYRAKDAGRANYQFYSAEMGAQARERVETESGLRRALERDELRLHYQPQLDLVSGQVVGFEALLRWQHPERGLVSPAAFIPVAEESGLIVPIGHWALRTACRDAAGWAAAGLGSLRIAVNLSARQFWQGSVTGAVRQALAESGLPAAQLEVELTETVVARDLQQVMNALAQLRRMGVSVAIDDFGTGYSSLAYLRSLPIQKLKIDRSFIQGIPLDAEAAALVAEIIRIAHVLSLSVVAEGVETAAQAAYLRDAGCEAMQGFLFARPMPADDCAVLLRSRRRLELAGNGR